ncbi:MAG: TRAP transporter substrate-binding protein [Peptococcaceae bacterium]|nr:TRAP transporter substrate-binding protein [Peptococcaceae bacterium]
MGSGWFETSEQALKALNGPFGDYFEQLLEEKANTKLLGWSGAGAVDCMLNNKRPVRNPEDLKGLKLRIANAAQMAQVEAFGAVGVVMSPNDMYLGVQRGTIDGVYSTSPSGAMTIKLTEIAKYYTRVDVSGTGVEHGFAMNLDKFNSLSKEQQDVLINLATEYGQKMLEVGIEMADEHWANLEAHGAEVTVVPKEEIPKWRAVWKDVGDKVLKEVVSEEEAQKLYELAMQSI